MEEFRDLSEIIGTEDLSGETCQAYLDQPAGSSYDYSDVLIPSMSCELLNDIMQRIAGCDYEQLAGEQFSSCDNFLQITDLAN